MADKAISELIAANQVTPTDLFVLEQSGTAKKLTGQVLENWLVSFADGHGGIQSIVKTSTSGLVDTYRITLADTTTFNFLVTNGRSITSISKTSTSGLVDTYTIRYNDNTSETFTVTNGAKGDKGDNTFTWIKYASQQPTASSHSFGDIPDDWVGIYFGSSSTAPTDWQQYSWFKIKGEKGDTGAPATLSSSSVEYQASDSGTIIPSGEWSASVPLVPQGKYLWTRTTQNFNTGSPVISYSVSRMGLDGSGSVSAVANISPDENGNIPLTARDIGALPSAGGEMAGPISMSGHTISEVQTPVNKYDAANKDYVDNVDKKVDTLRNVVSKFHSNIVETANGDMITLTDASDMELAGLKIFGETIQNGTPTPDAPVPLESVGDGGSISVKIGTSATDNAPQTLTVSTHNGLPGIAVTSGGNYTDENGQQWVCDEVDFASGKYVQRVGVVDLTSISFTYISNFWRYRNFITVTGAESVTQSIIPNAMCSTLKVTSWNAISSTDIAIAWLDNDCIVANGSDTVPPAGMLYYELAEHIEHDLSEAELAQYATLHTNYPNTTIFNDAGADMEVKYVADAKLYVDNKFAELASAIVNNV